MAFGDALSSSAEDPLVSFNFAIEVQDQVTGFFTEVTGLGSETEVSEHLVMGQKGQQVVKKIAGRLKWDDIVLKRGITTNMDIWDWRKSVEAGKLEESRRNGSIVMYDQMGQEVARWNFQRAWPSKVSGPQPKSDSGDISVEELTIVHEYIERIG